MDEVGLLKLKHGAEIAERRVDASNFQNSTISTELAAFNASKNNNALDLYIDVNFR